MTMNKLVRKNISRMHYVLMLISLSTGYFLCHILTLYFSIFPCRKNKKGDIIFFPFTQPGSDGFERRIRQYLPLFERDNTIYKVCSIYNDSIIQKIMGGNDIGRYRLFRKIFWIRFSQVLCAARYKSVFIQRGLFPLYPDQKSPHLEKLLYCINKNVTIDFWDSVWVYNSDLVDKTIKYCRQISCVNKFVYDHFKQSNKNKKIFPIGVDLKKYKIKTDYQTTNPVRLFYTGNPANVEEFLGVVNPVLNEISEKTKIILVLVTRQKLDTGKIRSEFHEFSEDTFFDLLAGSDIGLYAVEDSEISKGKMAMKVLDYLSAGLPAVASPYGILPGAENEKNLLIANDKEEWISAITRLCNDFELRKKLGTEGRKTAEREHNLEESYMQFRKMLLETNA